MTDSLGVVAATWGVLMALSPLLQVRRIVVRQSSADVSIAYLVVLEIGFVLWLAYGFALANPALMVPNAVALLLHAVAIAVAVRFARQAE